MRQSKFSISIEKVIKSLEDKSFGNVVLLSSSHKLYSVNNGIIIICTSKDYRCVNKTFWYSINPALISDNKVDNIILVAGYEGYFIIPSDYFHEYRTKYHVGRVKGDRENFTILKRNERYFRKELKNSEEDITKYFVSLSPA